MALIVIRPADRRLGHAVAVSALVAAVGYTITPLHAGMELVLIKRGMALAYGTMTVGFAVASD